MARIVDFDVNDPARAGPAEESAGATGEDGKFIVGAETDGTGTTPFGGGVPCFAAGTLNETPPARARWNVFAGRPRPHPRGRSAPRGARAVEQVRRGRPRRAAFAASAPPPRPLRSPLRAPLRAGALAPSRGAA